MRLSRKIFVNISFFYTLLVLAIAYSMSSPILIEISKKTGSSIGSMGYIFSFYFAGFILGSYLSSTLVKFFRRKKLLLFFTFLLSASVFSLFFLMNYTYLISAFFLIGLSGGFIESQVSILMIEINKKNEALFVNISQIFFGIGASIGPLLPVLGIRAGIDWKYSYLVAAALCLINFIYLLFIDISDVDSDITLVQKRAGSLLMPVKLKNKSVFILLIFMMFFYVCAETGLATWIPTFLRLDKFFTEVLAGQVLSFFWYSTIVGRILIGLLTKKIKILNLLTIITALTILFIISGVYLENNILIIISFILVGLFLAGIWPLIVIMGGFKYPNKRNFVVSVIILFGGVGGLTAPWLLGFILNRFNLFIAMNVVYVFLFFALVIIAVLSFLEWKNFAETGELLQDKNS